MTYVGLLKLGLELSETAGGLVFEGDLNLEDGALDVAEQRVVSVHLVDTQMREHWVFSVDITSVLEKEITRRR